MRAAADFMEMLASLHPLIPITPSFPHCGVNGDLLKVFIENVLPSKPSDCLLSKRAAFRSLAARCTVVAALSLQMASRVYLLMQWGEWDGGGVWEKLLSVVAIDEGQIRVLSGLGKACMETLLRCENFQARSVISP